MKAHCDPPRFYRHLSKGKHDEIGGGMTANTRRQYTEECKQEAVRLGQESVRLVARDLGIPENVLYRGRAQLRQTVAQAPHRAHNVARPRSSRA